ncbi:MAG TPA: hypothetical protein PLQ11_05390 [Beijerinckiaceae bacterium]|mgnify:CR=1 FL=1|nr:hypothetical protein [Beijerinckiaceae bacterium]
MKTRTQLAFIAPSVVMMLVFIAAPLITVFWQSFHVSQPVFETVRVENCTPAFLSQVCTTEEKTRPVLGPDGKMLMRSSFVGFSSQAHVISLQWLTYDFLKPDDSGNRSISRASASAMLTMVGVIVLLAPLLRRTWADFRGNRP